MTEQEKVIKIATAHKDLHDIDEVLTNFEKQKANNVAYKVGTNPDYTDSIIKSRKKHNLPAGKTLFPYMHTKTKRKFLKMYYDAVQDALKKIMETPVDDNK